MEDQERVLLATAILRESSREIIFELSEHHFKDHKNRILFNAIRSLLENEIELEFVSLKAYLESTDEFKIIGNEYFNKILIAETTYATKFIVEKMKEEYNVESLKQISGNVSSKKISINEGIEEINKLSTDEKSKYSSIQDLSKQDLDELYAEGQYVKTGFGGFDEQNGGFWNGELIVIAARPGLGKSALMLNIALRNNSLIISCEMMRNEVYGRILAKETAIDSRKIKLNKLNDEEKLKIMECHTTIGKKYNLIISDQFDNLHEMINFIKKMHKEKGIRIAFIDYLQLVRIAMHGNRNEKIGEITRTIKTTAQKLSMPICILSQLSREAENHVRPTLVHLRESGNIEQDANIVWFLWYDVKTGFTENIIAKNRDGVANYCFNLKFIKEISTFEEIEEIF